MRNVVGWMLMVVLGGAAGAAAAEETDARLAEAQTAFDEAAKLIAAEKYADAIAKSEHALALREAVLGSTDPQVATSLHQLGSLVPGPRAEPLLLRALAIAETTLGQNHPDVATILDSLASLHRGQGAFTRAEPLYERALSIREAAFGQHHPIVVTSLKKITSTYSLQHMHARAEPLLKRALTIQEAAFGKHDLRIAQSLVGLAALYYHMSQYARADPLLKRALSFQLDTESLSAIASLYFSRGEYSRARPLYERALTLGEQSFGKNHLHLIPALTSFVDFLASQGEYSQAMRLEERTLSILKASFGEDAPILAEVLIQMGGIRAAQHRIAEGVPLMARALALSEDRLRRETLGFSTSRLEGFLQLLRTHEDYIYSRARMYPTDAGMQRLALSTALLRKGRSSEEISYTSRVVYRSLDTQDRKTFEKLRDLRTQLSQLSLNGPRSLSPVIDQQSLKALADQSDALEADLAKRCAPLRALTALPSSSEIVERVADTLPSGSALIEFVTYVDRPKVPTSGADAAQQNSSLRYLALILFPDASIRTVDLGSAERIDRVSTNLRDVLAQRYAAYSPRRRDSTPSRFDPSADSFAMHAVFSWLLTASSA